MNNSGDNIEINEIYPRELSQRIRPYFESKEIIAIMDSRQSGKTTLLKIIFEESRVTKQCVFLTFEKVAVVTTNDNFGTTIFGNTTVYFIPIFYLRV